MNSFDNYGIFIWKLLLRSQITPHLTVELQDAICKSKLLPFFNLFNEPKLEFLRPISFYYKKKKI